MFTGVVERSIRVASVADGTGFRRLHLPDVWNDVKPGESVAVNGVCLTVAELGGGLLAFDVVPETLSKTNLGLLEAGERVHVERSLRVGDRIDGHFVQGHVDGQALLLDSSGGGGGADGAEYRLRLELPNELARYVVPKGSVCLDGVSLTVASVHGNEFEVALIPTTLTVTTLGTRGKGWPFNFEADVLVKGVVTTIERMGVMGARPT
jgi:riboflavin synthase